MLNTVQARWRKSVLKKEIGKERIVWVDVAKTMGIFLVIAGHTSGNTAVNTIVYSFHMPLFFFLSGYTYKVNTKSPFDKIRRCAKNYLIPYMIASVLTIIFIGVIGTTYYNMRSGIEFNNVLDNIVVMTKDTLLGYGIGMLWFLNVMFLSKLVMEFVAEYIAHYNLYLPILVLLFCGSLLMTQINVLPWNLDILPIALFYIVLGFTFNKKGIKFNIFLGFLMLLVWGILVSRGISLNINERWYNGLSIANSVMAIYFFLSFISFITSKRKPMFMVNIGKNSLYLYIIHHLERMEISYIWDGLYEMIELQIGTLAYWVVCSIRILVVLFIFGLLNLGIQMVKNHLSTCVVEEK